MFCPKCGNPLEEGAKFCPKCGEPVALDQTKGTGSAQPSSSGDNQVISIIEKVLACCFVLFFVIRAITTVVNYFRFLHYGMRWYNQGFVIIALFVTLILAASTLLLGVVLFACGFPKDRGIKAHLLVAVAAAVVIRLLTTLLSYVSSEYWWGARWVDFVMGVIGLACFVVLAVIADSKVFGQLKGEDFAGWFRGAIRAVVESIQAVFGGSKSGDKATAGAAAGAATAAAAATVPTVTATPDAAGQTYSAGAPVNGPIATDRSLALYIILSIITCGIYGYWFIYTMARDMNTIGADDDENTGGLAVFILLSFITCGFYSFYWQYKLGNRMQTVAARQYGITIQENGTTILMWDIIGLVICGIGTFVAIYLLIKNMNLLATEYNRQHGF